MTMLKEDDNNAMAAAIAKFGTRVDHRRSARNQRRKQAISAGDGRSLRATGRDQQMNFRASTHIKSLVKKHVGEGGISLWMEEAIIEKLRKQGVKIDE
jgi:hypothetical protein